MKNFISILCTAVTLCLAMASCHTTRTTTPETTPTETAEWERLSMPVTLRLLQPKVVTLSGQATMDRGRSVNISLRVFGMEVGWVNITNDSVLVVDKFHKYYFAETLDALVRGHDIDVATLQDLLLGRAKVPEDLAALNIKVLSSDPTQTPYGPISQVVHILATAGETPIDAQAVWRIDKVKWNEQVTLRNTSVPSNYLEITAQEIPKILNSL